MKSDQQGRKERDWARRVSWVLLLVAAALAVIWLYNRFALPAPQAAVAPPTLVTSTGAPPEIAVPFSAINQYGKTYTFNPANGKVTALFFGFTNCKDTCPITLSSLGKARRQLPPKLRDDVQIILVSLDPQRDTPKRLREYLPLFDADMTGLHVAEPALKKVAQAYGVAYAQGEVSTEGEYEVYHTSATYLIGRDGELRLMYAQVPPVDRLVQDLQEVLAE